MGISIGSISAGFTTSVVEPSVADIAAPELAALYPPQASSYAGPTGTVRQTDATYVVNNGQVSLNGAVIGTVNDAGDYSVTIGGQAFKGNVAALIGATVEGTLSTGATIGAAGAIPGVSDDQIRAFYATNPSGDQIEAKARELHLTNTQIMHAMEVGTGIDFETAPSWQVMGAYEQANHITGTYARHTFGGGGRHDRSLYSPNLGREITPAEIAAFYAKKPSASQVLAKAAELGISAAAIPDASAFGAPGDGQDAQFLKMSFSLNTGAHGYGSNSAGQVVSVKDPGAMYSSDPIHTGLDRYFSGKGGRAK